MPRVCEKEYPLGTSFDQRKDGFYMHTALKSNLDVLIKNVKKDWDYVILISGGGQVRVGKSLLALQIGAYWSAKMNEIYGANVPFDVDKNIVFKGEDLIKKGNYLGRNFKHSCLIFDEAGADLEGVKVMQKSTQAVKDFLRECGQYNMLTILVLPEFFDLPKGVAMSRSDFLIDCFVVSNDNDEWERGHFNFYSRIQKKHLYRKGKKELDYKAHSPNFSGDWLNFYPVNEADYRAKKVEALKQRETKFEAHEEKRLRYLRGAVKYLHDELEMTQQEIADKVGEVEGFAARQKYISRILNVDLRKLDDEEYDDTENTPHTPPL